MKLKRILKGIYYEGKIRNFQIKNVTEILSRVTQGSLFVAVRGASENGEKLIEAAIRHGAVAIMCEGETLLFAEAFSNVAFIRVVDARRALALAASNFYKNPADKLRIIGITGTNGKTTTSFMLWHILSKTVGKTGLIGTVKNIGADDEPVSKTTPCAEDLHRMFFKMVKKGYRCVVVEASSQGLFQRRTEGIRFEVGAFTNFSPEHTDYHKTEDDYFNAKYIICSLSDCMLVNADDTKAKEFYGARFFSAEKQTDFYATNITLTKKSSYFVFNTKNEKESVRVPCIGLFNVYNALCAASAAVLLGVSAHAASVAIADFRGVEGRQEFVLTSFPFDVVVDYAHTPDSLEKVLKALREITDGRLICVFGCGGDRDRAKRSLMGKISSENADFTIITTDNPRTEPPMQIIDGITAGIDDSLSGKYTVVPNRRAAIEYALRYAQTADTVLIAGKGHEKYQKTGTNEVPFDEKEIIQRMRL